jgi:Flp pilus assembly protein TadG
MRNLSFSTLRRDENGVATVEFALWVTGFFVIIMVAMDFGMLFIERGKVNEAVAASAVASFEEADNVNFAVLPSYVRSIANNPAINVSTSCNGVANSCTNLNRTCACLKTDGSYVATACGNICTGSDMTGGSTSGYYLTIEATQAFTPVVLPSGLLSDMSLSQQATVRLQ